jgi:hypothetical protein
MDLSRAQRRVEAFGTELFEHERVANCHLTKHQLLRTGNQVYDEVTIGDPKLLRHRR